MDPLSAYRSLSARTGGIQGCILMEEMPGVWTGEMISRMHLQDVSGDHDVQVAQLGAVSESVMVVGARRDAVDALQSVRLAAGGGMVALSPSGCLILKAMGIDLGGRPRVPDMDRGGYIGA